jgi:hypothetical protein
MRKRTTTTTKRGKLNSEQWLLELARKHAFDGALQHPTSQCVSEEFRGQYAKNPDRFRLSDARVEHVVGCGYCFPRLLDLRSQNAVRKTVRWRTAIMAVACAACLATGMTFMLFWYAWPARVQNSRPSAERPVEQAEVTREIDLSGYERTRGLGDTEMMSLPVAIVHLKLILPRPSPTGHYKVAVSAADKLIASGEGAATGPDISRMLIVTLDLRNAASGSYVLSTEGEQDGGAYYYPLTLR